MSRYGILISPMVFAAGDWWAVARGRRHLEYICKPATMLTLIIAAWLGTQGPHDPWQARFFLPGFALSLAGDIFLMLRREQLFLPGLLAFLLAHTCYIVGLNSTMPPGYLLLGLIPVAGIGAAFLQRLGQGLRERGRGELLVPVAVYSLVLGVMLSSAWGTLLRPTWAPLRAGFAAIGASLFFVSDAMLAWDRFVGSFRTARLWIHVTYHLGQVALAASMLLTA